MHKNAPLILTLIVGTFLAIGATLMVREWETDRTREAFSHAASQHQIIIRQRLFSTLDAVESIGALYAASEEVTRDEFRRFTEFELGEQYHSIQALEWIPRVKAADRAAFEAAAREDGHEGFTFTERNSRGRMVPAAARDEYFPVYFIEPYRGNEAALGFDLGSNPARLAALERARDSGKLVATERITLVQETATSFGFLVFQPVYRNDTKTDTVEDRRQNLQGFALGVLRVDDFVGGAELAAHDLAKRMDVFVFDQSAPAGRQLLYPNNSPFETLAEVGSADCVIIPETIGGRDWAIAHCPANGGASPVDHRQSLFVLILGLLVTGVMANYLRSLSNQRAHAANMAADLAQLIDTANAPIFGIDVEGKINEWNQAAARITGFTKNDVTGHDLVAEFISEEYRAPVKEVMDKALRGEETSNFEFPLYSKAGKRVDVLLNSTTRRDAAGDIVGVIGIGQDITDLKTEERESFAIAQELTQLIDTSNAPIFGVDVEGKINEWNQAAARITGFTKDDVTGHDLVAEFITEEYRAPVKEVMDKALRGEETSNFEFPLYSKAGKRVDVLLNLTTRLDIAGDIVGVIGIGQDITERKLVESALTESEARYRDIVDNARVLIQSIDPDEGRFVFTNRAWRETLGYNTDEVPALGIADVVHPDSMDHCMGVLRDVLDGLPVGNIQATFVSKDGRKVEVEGTVICRRNEDGTRTTHAVFTDITARKQAEAQVIQTAKLATLGEMATSVAHELNQPLNVIRMAAGNVLRKLEKGKADPTYLNDKLERIASQTERAAAIIDHMRMFGRKADEKPTELDPREMVRGALDLMGEQLRLAEIGVSLDLPETCPPVLGHRVQMEQVILNLLTNARDAVGANENEMKIALAVGGDDEDVRITVSDNGGGIPEKILGRIFEPFFTTKEMGKGTGLGLSVSYGIIRDMGGTIEAENAGGGAKFTITLPVAAKDAEKGRSDAV